LITQDERTAAGAQSLRGRALARAAAAQGLELLHRPSSCAVAALAFEGCFSGGAAVLASRARETTARCLERCYGRSGRKRPLFFAKRESRAEGRTAALRCER